MFNWISRAIVTTLTFSSIFFIGCLNDKSDRERKLDIKEQQLNSKAKALEALERDNQVRENNATTTLGQTTTKYVFAVFKVEAPELHHTGSEYVPDLDVDGVDNSYEIPEYNKVTFAGHIITCQVERIDQFNEESKYMYLDRMEYELRHRLGRMNLDFEVDVINNVRNLNERHRLVSYKARIVDRKVKTFDSYSEASIERNGNLGSF